MPFTDGLADDTMAACRFGPPSTPRCHERLRVLRTGNAGRGRGLARTLPRQRQPVRRRHRPAGADEGTPAPAGTGHQPEEDPRPGRAAFRCAARPAHRRAGDHARGRDFAAGATALRRAVPGGDALRLDPGAPPRHRGRQRLPRLAVGRHAAAADRRRRHAVPARPRRHAQRRGRGLLHRPRQDRARQRRAGHAPAGAAAAAAHRQGLHQARPPCRDGTGHRRRGGDADAAGPALQRAAHRAGRGGADTDPRTPRRGAAARPGGRRQADRCRCNRQPAKKHARSATCAAAPTTGGRWSAC